MMAEAQAETALQLSEKDQKLSPMQRIHTEEHVNNQRGAMLVFKR